MQYFMPEKQASVWTDKPQHYSEYGLTPMLNDVQKESVGIGWSLARGDFTLEIYFRVKEMGSTVGYTTVLAINRINNGGNAVDVMFTDTSWGGYLSICFRASDPQSDTTNHSYTYNINMTRDQFKEFTHVAFVRRSNVLYAYVNGTPVQIRQAFNSWSFSVSGATHPMDSLGPRSNTRTSNNNTTDGNTSKLWTETKLVGLWSSARYSGNFVPGITSEVGQERNLVFM